MELPLYSCPTTTCRFVTSIVSWAIRRPRLVLSYHISLSTAEGGIAGPSPQYTARRHRASLLPTPTPTPRGCGLLYCTAKQWRCNCSLVYRRVLCPVFSASSPRAEVACSPSGYRCGLQGGNERRIYSR